MHAAAREQNVPYAEVQKLLRAVMLEHENHCFWPKGF